MNDRRKNRAEYMRRMTHIKQTVKKSKEELKDSFMYYQIT
jgi:hypothetical protein